MAARTTGTAGVQIEKVPVPNIAQLVERSTVDVAGIEWSLVRFRVFGILEQFGGVQTVALHPAEQSDSDKTGSSIGLVVMTSA